MAKKNPIKVADGTVVGGDKVYCVDAIKGVREGKVSYTRDWKKKYARLSVTFGPYASHVLLHNDVVNGDVYLSKERAAGAHLAIVTNMRDKHLEEATAKLNEADDPKEELVRRLFKGWISNHYDRSLPQGVAERVMAKFVKEHLGVDVDDIVEKGE